MSGSVAAGLMTQNPNTCKNSQVPATVSLSVTALTNLPLKLVPETLHLYLRPQSYLVCGLYNDSVSNVMVILSRMFCKADTNGETRRYVEKRPSLNSLGFPPR